MQGSISIPGTDLEKRHGIPLRSGPLRLRDSLATHSTRFQLTHAARELVRSSGKPVSVEDSSVSGLRILFEPAMDQQIKMKTELSYDTPLQLMPPPAIGVLQPDPGMRVGTRREADADLDYLDPELVLPRITDRVPTEPEWTYLARTVLPNGSTTAPVDTRFVEPGVGRTYLLDVLHFADAPEYLDFSVTGAGRTPYSAGGLRDIGNHDDGYVPLVRAHHRHRMSRMIAAEGGRVPRTGAIIILREHSRHEANGEEIPVALLVRGFRNVLRVKQLDPIANLMLSRSRWDAIQAMLRTEAESVLRSAPSPGPCRCLTPSIVLGNYPTPKCSAARTCNALRRRHIRSAAPAMILDARERLAFEALGDPAATAFSMRQFVMWFSETLGKQLGLLRALRILHDYRVINSSRHYNSLGDTNVTLAAELPDLDTLIRVDEDPDYARDVFGITADQQRYLADGFLHFHLHEVALAFGVTLTLANAASLSDADTTRFLRAAFNQGYTIACGCPAW
jgi:hypothetical protein